MDPYHYIFVRCTGITDPVHYAVIYTYRYIDGHMYEIPVPIAYIVSPSQFSGGGGAEAPMFFYVMAADPLKCDVRCRLGLAYRVCACSACVDRIGACFFFSGMLHIHGFL